ncbi:MAG TPA: hypothetical protein DCS55_02775 [Acidimicrobiaceae bacterium]|nr:hypothetical protein [Acidimicrobiaceae bacterium]
MTAPARTAAGDAELLLTLVERQLRVRSKRSMLGMVWPSVSPLVMLALYSYVFNRVFNVPVERYPEFLFAGLLPWAFLSQSVATSIPSLSVEAPLVRRAPFRHELVPMANVLAHALYFVVSTVGFCAYLAWHGRLAWSVLPALVAPMLAVVVFGAGLCQVLALFDVYNRDLRWVVGNVLTIWFFLLPIVYRPQMVPEGLQFLQSTDPMNMIVGQFRDVLYYGSVSRPGHMALMLIVSAVFFVVCTAVFRRCSGELPKDL